MPNASAVPVGGRASDLDGYEIHFYTPIDDEHSWRFDFGFRRSRTIVPEDVVRRQVLGPDYHRIPNKENHYLQDREQQRTYNFTGMADFLSHDSCATETMGHIYDRRKEHLGSSDMGVIAVRRYLLDVVKAFQKGEEPPLMITDPSLNDYRHADSIAVVIDTTDWHPLYPHLVGSVGELPGRDAREPVGSRA
jgi:hypothetical protein